MVIELIELEVVVLMKHEFAKRAALGGAQLWGKLAYYLISLTVALNAISQGLVSRIFYCRKGRCRAEKKRAISGEMSDL
jgi:hypothetical protein